MSRTEREDATAKALDILPPGDEARSDPRLLRDPELLDEARLTREAAADLWLAVSPLRAAPSDVLHTVMAKIDAKPPAAAKVRRFTPWLAASGWAAAAAVTVMLWPHSQQGGFGPGWAKNSKGGTVESPNTPVTEGGSKEMPSKVPEREDRRLRMELMKLRGSLARLNDGAFTTAPRVMSLSSPGALERTPEEARERVWSVLTGALRSALEAESGAPGDSSDLVIERGWLPDAVTIPEDGGVIRHRNFPEVAWKELGLQRSDDGSYFDEDKGLVWTKDEEGRGFIGRKATEADDLSVFKPPGQALELAVNQPRTDPEGFVIEDPVTNKAEVVIDQVPPPGEGMFQEIVWKDASGVEGRMRLGTAQAYESPGKSPAANPSANPLVFQGNPSLQGLLSNTIVVSIPNSGGVQSFQLIETPIVPNGKPLKVIVKGGK